MQLLGRARSTKKLRRLKAANAQDQPAPSTMRGGDIGLGHGESATMRDEHTSLHHQRSKTASDNTALHHQYRNSQSNDVTNNINGRPDGSRSEGPRHFPSTRSLLPGQGSSPIWPTPYRDPTSPRILPLHSPRSSTSTGEAIIYRSQIPDSPPPNTGVTALPRPSMDRSHMSLRRKRSGWHSLSNILHRKETTSRTPETASKTTPPSPVSYRMEPQTKQVIRVSFDSATSPYSLPARSPLTSLPTIASSGVQNAKQSHRSLSRFEARAQADRASFSQNPSFPSPPPINMPHMLLHPEEAPTWGREKADGATPIVPGPGHLDMYHAVQPTSELNLNSIDSELDQLSVALEKAPDQPEPSIRERRRQRLERLPSDPNMTAGTEENKPLRTPRSHSPLSSNGPEDYVSVNEARLQECREKLAATMPRLRPLHRAMTAPSLVTLVPSPPSQQSSTVGSDGFEDEDPQSECHDERDKLRPVHSTAGHSSTTHELPPMPSPSLPHPGAEVEQQRVLSSTPPEANARGRQPTHRSASSPLVYNELPFREFTQSRHNVDHNEVHIHVARKLSVDLMTPRLRPKLLDLMPTNRKTTAVRVQCVERGQMSEEKEEQEEEEEEEKEEDDC